MSQERSRLLTDDHGPDETLPTYEEAIQHQHARGSFSLNDEIQNSDGDVTESDDGQEAEEDKPRSAREVGIRTPPPHAQQTLAQPTAPPSNVGAQQYYDPYLNHQHPQHPQHSQHPQHPQHPYHPFHHTTVQPSAPPAPEGSSVTGAEPPRSSSSLPTSPVTGAPSSFPGRPPFPGYPNTFPIPFPGAGVPGVPGVPGLPGGPGGFGGFGGMYPHGGYFGPPPPSGYPDAARPFHPGFIPGGQPFMMRPPPISGFPFHLPPPSAPSPHTPPRQHVSPTAPTAPVMPTSHVPMSSHPEAEDKKTRIDEKSQIPPLPTSLPVPMAPSAPQRSVSPYAPEASAIPRTSGTSGTSGTFASFGMSSLPVSGPVLEDHTEVLGPMESMENTAAAAAAAVATTTESTTLNVHEPTNGQDVSAAGFTQTPNGYESTDPILEDPFQLYRFFVAHNDRPSMHLLITGTRDVSQSSQEHLADGTIKVEIRKVKINDFKIVLDLTPYISTSGTLKTLQDPKTGRQPTLREVMEEHVNDGNYFKELHMEKKVAWNYVKLTDMITHAIRSMKYQHTIEISYPIANHWVKVRSSSPAANFLRSEVTGFFSVLSIVGFGFYALREMTKKIKDKSLQSVFRMTITEKEFYDTNRRTIIEQVQVQDM